MNAPSIGFIKSKKVKKNCKNAKISSKRFAASTLEQNNDFDSSLFDSFHRKTPVTRPLDMKNSHLSGKRKHVSKKSRQRTKPKTKTANTSQISKKKVYKSEKPTPEPNFNLANGRQDFILKAETKSFDNVPGLPSKVQSNSTVNLNFKQKRGSKSKKRSKNKNSKKMESPYSSHQKSDHTRSKSSCVKGPKILKSIFQIYREAGMTGKSSKNIKQSQNINSTLPIHVGKDSFRIGGINFKMNKHMSRLKCKPQKEINLNSYMVDLNTRSRSNEKSDLPQSKGIKKVTQNDYVQIEDKSHNLSCYLNPNSGVNSSGDSSVKTRKSPTVNKAVSLYAKVANKKVMKYKKNKHDLKSKAHHAGSKERKKPSISPKKNSVYNYQIKNSASSKSSG